MLSALVRLTSSLAPELQGTDFNLDGIVDIMDYALVLTNLGEVGEPPF